MKKLFVSIFTCALILSLTACSGSEKYADANIINLSDSEITVNGKSVGSDAEASVFLSNDIIFYEDKDEYDSGNPYGEGEDSDKHSAEDAAKNTVINITEAGTYCIRGTLSAGQLRIDLGENASTDPDAVVTLIFDGADISCDVAPAVLFMNVYECDNGWSTDTAKSDVDTSAAGANVIIADGSVNNISGSHVAKIFKDNDEEKKLWKQDGAFYSYMSMNIDGEEAGDGVLNITADNEGLDTELHLSINGGKLNIRSQDDGINTNEDGVSVTTINGGNLHILAGLGAEGDGIDSNGWLVINGGNVISMANPASDAGLDSDMGSYINGGTVVALGSTMDWPESDSEQVTINLQFSNMQDAGNAIVVKDTDGSFVFAYDPSEDEVAASNIRKYQGAVISCPLFELEKTYNVFLGGSITGTELCGIYDVDSITDYEDGIKQAYTGTDIQGGMGGGMMPPERPDGEMPEPPDDKMPEIPDGETPQKPDGEAPQKPDGEASQDNPPAKPNGEDEKNMPTMPFDSTAASTEFYMQDKVNSFSGVCAEK